MNQERPLFILAGNGPYENRGCEAIIRGTVNVIRRQYKDPQFVVCSQFKNKEGLVRQQRSEEDTAIRHVRMRLLPSAPAGIIFGSFLNKVLWKIYSLAPGPRREYVYQEIAPFMDRAEAVLSVGGDNYTSDYSTIGYFIDLDDYALSRKKKLIIWGASIGPFSKDSDRESSMAEHLKKQTALFVRESVSLEYLSTIGVRHNVFRCIDPAFTMTAKEPRDAFQYGELASSVGVNLSPLMSRFVCAGDDAQWLALASDTVRSIYEASHRPILLIPHVFEEGNDDLSFLDQICKQVNLPDVKVLSGDHDAAETKWFISNCSVFVGARTHSAIAAYSTNVPALTLSYSAKAKGLNEDIYGDPSFCIPASEYSADKVTTKIMELINKRQQICDSLKDKINRMVHQAYESGRTLKEICEGQIEDLSIQDAGSRVHSEVLS